MAEPTILVTGASGFIGGRLTEVLYQRGQPVRAGVRRWSSAARLARMDVAITPCDIMDPAQTDEAMAGVEVVVHCAYNDRREVIVDGTANVLRAAAAAGVRQVVYLSSAEIYGVATGRIDEEQPGVGPFSHYATAKREAEARCAAFQKQGGAVTILRPSIVHGPFSSRTIKFAQRLLSGRWSTFEGLGEGQCNLIYIDDVVAAILATVDQPAAYGQTYNLNGPETLSWNDYFERFNAALGRPPLTSDGRHRAAARALVRDRVQGLVTQARTLADEPLQTLYQRGGLPARLMKQLKSALFTAPTGKELKTLYSREAHYDATKIRRELALEPRVDVDRGLSLCVAWLAHHGYLPERGVARDVACPE